jgi:hypothetical protein
METVIVEFEVDISKVGKGYFERKLSMEMFTKDAQGNVQIKPVKMAAPLAWK